ncbi:hypothetical protein PISMIDRAFT_181158 [Pisolithus microcarpus 441]|uniref:Uncharacterized protein n=1 Tax=Pisolithus microcarpus 441 TaxID=765257 RepID=A0A0C9YPQ4_9AGAM|nr:hypothetical protein PISMIDRAFT_181158 [Pisolithus microcarpus 441]
MEGATTSPLHRHSLTFRATRLMRAHQRIRHASDLYIQFSRRDAGCGSDACPCQLVSYHQTASIYPWLLDLMLGSLNAPDELVYGQKTNLQTHRNHT